MRLDRTDPSLFGIVLYPSVEPIDLGATFGVLTMARRLIPAVRAVTLATRPGRVMLAGGLEVSVDHTLHEAPPLDVAIVAGGARWPDAAKDPAMIDFLTRNPATIIASVCTGALILQAAGLLAGRTATTRRLQVGEEDASPLSKLHHGQEAVFVDHGSVVTGGGVMLATDTTLYLLSRLYGGEVALEVARAIEYDRAWEANTLALNALVVSEAAP